MKFSPFLAIFLAMPALASSLPEKLVCTGTKFLAGEKNFSDPTDYFPRTITPGKATPNPMGPWVSAKNGTVTLTYIDGDQYEVYSFSQSDLDEFTAQSTNRIQGTFEDGFEWSNGYNVRARFAIDCRR
ncbi:hypothetical protein EBZ37_09385 [bacterium]|nr:hypothetical protein [bacterium]